MPMPSIYSRFPLMILQCMSLCCFSVFMPVAQERIVGVALAQENLNAIKSISPRSVIPWLSVEEEDVKIKKGNRDDDIVTHPLQSILGSIDNGVSTAGADPETGVSIWMSMEEETDIFVGLRIARYPSAYKLYRDLLIAAVPYPEKQEEVRLAWERAQQLHNIGDIEHADIIATHLHKKQRGINEIFQNIKLESGRETNLCIDVTKEQDVDVAIRTFCMILTGRRGHASFMLRTLADTQSGADMDRINMITNISDPRYPSLQELHPAYLDSLGIAVLRYMNFSFDEDDFRYMKDGQLGIVTADGAVVNIPTSRFYGMTTLDIPVKIKAYIAEELFFRSIISFNELQVAYGRASKVTIDKLKQPKPKGVNQLGDLAAPNSEDKFVSEGSNDALEFKSRLDLFNSLMPLSSVGNQNRLALLHWLENNVNSDMLIKGSSRHRYLSASIIADFMKGIDIYDSDLSDLRSEITDIMLLAGQYDLAHAWMPDDSSIAQRVRVFLAGDENADGVCLTHTNSVLGNKQINEAIELLNIIRSKEITATSTSNPDSSLGREKAIMMSLMADDNIEYLEPDGYGVDSSSFTMPTGEDELARVILQVMNMFSGGYLNDTRVYYIIRKLNDAELYEYACRFALEMLIFDDVL